jgi:hypothetical protein
VMADKLSPAQVAKRIAKIHKNLDILYKARRKVLTGQYNLSARNASRLANQLSRAIEKLTEEMHVLYNTD